MKARVRRYRMPGVEDMGNIEEEERDLGEKSLIQPSFS
jgi:hypothetical protein